MNDPAATETYYQDLCENLGVTVIATDRDLNIRTWNAAAARTFGAAAERMIGTPIARIIPQARRAVTERMLRRAIEAGETIQIEFDHRDGQGRARELAGTIAPVVARSGERIGASICIRDITRRIDLQSELLENRKMVALGEMAGAIAHHFNNILGGAVTSIDFALKSDAPEVQGRVLTQVERALQRAVSLVGGLLAFAQGDQREAAPADLARVIRSVVAWTQRQIEGHPIEFQHNVPELPPLAVAEKPVTTILQNVMRNAIEAMPDGGRLTLDVTRCDGAIEVVITDTGCGLDDALKTRIFEPFWSTKGLHADGASDAKGLGLAIAHGLVRMIGGSIAVDSAVGTGTSFRIKLPLAPTAADPTSGS